MLVLGETRKHRPDGRILWVACFRIDHLVGSMVASPALNRFTLQSDDDDDDDDDQKSISWTRRRPSLTVNDVHRGNDEARLDSTQT